MKGLVDCATCGGMHSTEAAVCPHCGQPIDKEAARRRLAVRLDQQWWRSVRIWTMVVAIAAVCFGCCLCGRPRTSAPPSSPAEAAP